MNPFVRLLLVICITTAGGIPTYAGTGSAAPPSDDETPEVFVAQSVIDDSTTDDFGNNALTLTLHYGFIPGIEYSRRILPHIDVSVGLATLGLMPNAGIRVRAMESALSPYVYGNVGEFALPGTDTSRYIAGGLGAEYRHKSGFASYLQAGALRDQRDGTVLPDVVVGLSWRF